MGISVKELRKLKTLLDEGVITKEEFLEARNEILKGDTNDAPSDDNKNKVLESESNPLINETSNGEGTQKNKEVQVIGKQNKVNVNSDVPAREKRNAIQYIKSNIALLLVTAALAGLSVYFGVQLSNTQEELDKAVTRAKNAERLLTTYEANSRKYETLLSDFYLDNAVVTIKGDDRYYHRYGCPDTPMGKNEEYMFNVFNVDLARQEGFAKCPTCFKDNGLTYIDNTF